MRLRAGVGIGDEAPVRRTGYERITNTFDLFPFQQSVTSDPCVGYLTHSLRPNQRATRHAGADRTFPDRRWGLWSLLFVAILGAACAVTILAAGCALYFGYVTTST